MIEMASLDTVSESLPQPVCGLCWKCSVFYIYINLYFSAVPKQLGQHPGLASHGGDKHVHIDVLYQYVKGHSMMKGGTAMMGSAELHGIHSGGLHRDPWDPQ